MNILPTSYKFAEHKVQVEELYPLCGLEKGIVEHCNFFCHTVILAWFGSELGTRWTYDNVQNQKWLNLILTMYKEDTQFRPLGALAIFIAYYIWNKWNEVCFDRYRFNTIDNVKQARKQWKGSIQR